jgi:predicted transcriptional regulator
MKVRHIAPRTAIVSTLKKHGQAHVDFLANEINRKPSEVEDYLQSLAKAGVIRRQDGRVSLVNASE